MRGKQALRLLMILIPLVLTAMLLLAISAYADTTPTSGTIGSCTWTFNPTNGMLDIRGVSGVSNPTMPDFEHYQAETWTDASGTKHPSDVPWIKIRQQIKAIQIFDVNHIGNGAFYHVGSPDYPVTVLLGKDDISIGDDAFCKAKLKSINLSRVKGEIGKRAFYNIMLTEPVSHLMLNASKIGEKAFYSLYGNIDLLTLHVKEIGDYAFNAPPVNRIAFRKTVTKIGDGAFYDCKSVREISFADDISCSIGKYAFAGFRTGGEDYYGVTGINVPGTITSIGEKAFGYNVSGGNIDGRRGDFIIFTEEGSAADRYAKAAGIYVEYGKTFYTNYYDSDWAYDASTKTCWINCNENYRKWTENYTGPLSTPDASDEYWSDFVEKNDVEHVIIGGGRQGWVEDHVEIVSKGLQMLPNLESLEISYLTTHEIAEEACKGLKNLQTITFCSEKASEGEGLLSIDLRAFDGCTALTNLTLPDSLTELGVGAFANCSSLTSVNFGTGLTTVNADAFKACGLTTLDFGSKGPSDSPLTLGAGIFAECQSLKKVTLGPRVTAMALYMFQNCTSLTDLSYSDKLTSIEYRALAGCSKLQNFMIGLGLRELGDEALLDTQVNELFLPEFITSFGRHCLCYVSSDSGNVKMNGAKLYVIQDSAGESYVRSAGIDHEVCVGETLGSLSWRFNETTGELHIAGTGPMQEYGSANSPPWELYAGKVKSAYIGDGITSISSMAFAETFLNLEEIYIGTSVTSIGYRAFYGGVTSKLTAVEIPEEVTAIEPQAFGYGKDAYGKEYKMEDLVLYVMSGSAGETYAIENDLKYESAALVGNLSSSVSYELYPGVGKLIIWGSGNIPDFTKTYQAPWYRYRNKIKCVIIKEGITIIGKKAFMGFSNLERAVLPESLTRIRPYAFANARNGLVINLPSSVTMMEENCLSFYSFSPDNSDPDREAMGTTYTSTVLSMDYPTVSQAFSYYRSNFVDASVISYDLGRHGEAADCCYQFDGRKLYIYGDGSFDCSDQVYPWNDWNSDDCWVNDVRQVYLDRRLEQIPPEAFDGMTYLNAVYYHSRGNYAGSFGDSTGKIRSIGSRAFAYCCNLKTIKIPDAVDVIEESTFEACENLQSISMNVRSIGNCAFDGCDALTDVTLGDRLEFVDNGAFANTSIEHIVLPETLSHIGDGAFENSCLYDITIPENVRTIGERAFHTTYLTTVEIPKNVRTIGAYAFGFQWDWDNYIQDDPVPGFTITAKKNSAGYLYAKQYNVTWLDPLEGDIGDIHWTMNEKKGVLTLSGEGAIPNYALPWDSDGQVTPSVTPGEVTENGTANSAAPWSRHAGQIKSIIIDEGITRIGANAFASLSAASEEDTKQEISLRLPGSVESIGGYAFCMTKLDGIKIPSGVLTVEKGAFWGTEAPGIDLGDTVQAIGAKAFVNTSEESIEIPSSVTSIGEYAFNFSKQSPTAYPGPGEYSVRCNTYLIKALAGTEAQRYADADENISFEELIPEEPPAPAHEHDMTFVQENPPTETEDGWVEYYVCDLCGEWFWDLFGDEPIEDHSLVVLPKTGDDPGPGDDPEPVKPAISKTKATLKAGKTLALKVTDGKVSSWKSSKKTVAKVSSSGKVTALKKGTATITATLSDGKKLTCKITVSTNPTITVGGKKYKAATTYKVKKGKTLTVKITGRASSVANVYSTTKKSVAKVTTSNKKTSTVKIKGLKAGSATVTIKVNGVAFKIKVKVVK